MTSSLVRVATAIETTANLVDTHCMEDREPPQTDVQAECVVCQRDAVTIDRSDTGMCAKHAAMFVTAEHRRNLANKARVVR